jgi:hypothetical protein
LNKPSKNFRDKRNDGTDEPISGNHFQAIELYFERQ